MVMNNYFNNLTEVIIMFWSMIRGTRGYQVDYQGRRARTSKFWVGTFEDLMAYMAYVSDKSVLFLEARKAQTIFNRCANKIFKACGRETNHTGKNFHK